MATLQLPPGVTISCSVLFIPASTIILGLRFYTRRLQKAQVGLDDWLMIPAFVLLIGMQIDMTVAVSKHMIGYADPHRTPGKPDASSNLPSWPFELMEVPALGLVKLSVVLFYRRIFNTGATPWHHRGTMVLIVLVTAWTLSFFFSFLFICRDNPAAYWTSAQIEKTECVATDKLHMALAVSDTILDCLIMLIAIPMIWGLSMTMGRKLAVTGIFCLGLITVAVSITRMVIFIQAAALRFDPHLDFEFFITSVLYWSMLEAGLGFLAANLIICYSLIAHWGTRLPFHSLKSLFGSKGSRSGISTGRETIPTTASSHRPLYSDMHTDSSLRSQDGNFRQMDEVRTHLYKPSESWLRPGSAAGYETHPYRMKQVAEGWDNGYQGAYAV